MNPEAMSEEYRNFAQGAPGLRKVTLQFMKLNPQVSLPLFMQVYQYDPDPELRQLALEVLRSQGVTPMRDGEPAADQVKETNPTYAEPAASLFSSGSALRDAGIGGIKASDALSRSEDKARKALADRDDSPAPGPTAFVMSNTADAAGMTLDGGPGRPVQRGSHLSDVFTIHKGNIKYLRGEQDRPVSEFWGYIVGIAITVIVVGIMFAADSQQTLRSANSERPPWEFILPIAIGFDFLLIFLMIRSSRQAKLFAENGQLLLGQIISAHGRWVTTGSGKSRSRSFKVTVSYRVRMPDGEVRDSSDTQTRGDLARGGVPQPGEQIAVLVLPDSKKMRLL